MTRLARTLLSSIGSKMVMAVTGLLLLLFVIGHMLGNLQVFAGPEQLNAYAAKLQSMGPLLWLVRFGLLAIFLLHVAAALKVNAANRAARPETYHYRATLQTGIAARTMLLGGLLILAFLVYHILHFTLGVTDPENFHLTDAQGHHDVYSMVVLGFRQWPVAVSYIVAQVLLGMHISHGASSAFQTLGVTHPRLIWLKTGLGPFLGTIIVIGNVSIPLACLLGLVPLPPLS